MRIGEDPFASPPPGHRILPRQTVPMRDGAGLTTDVYLPAATGAHPVVLIRTPYGRTLPFLLLLAQRLSRAGMAAVLQDSRGRYGSDGTFDWSREDEDAYDTLLWLREQSWCRGRVALLGLSFSSHAVFAVAAGEPIEGLEIATVVSVMGAVDYHSLFFRGGALVLHWALPWVTILSGTQGTFSAKGFAGRPWSELLRHLPLAELPRDVQVDQRLWRLITSHPEYGGLWLDLDVRPRLPRVRVPTLHLSGWFDFMLPQAVDAYRALTATGAAGAPHRFVVGPWDHRSIFHSFASAESREAAGGESLQGVVLDWLARCLEDGAAGAPLRSGIDAYVLESGTWLTTEALPPAGVELQDWYLTSGGRAATAVGDGRLQPQPPGDGGYDRFSFDPADPVPTVGGAVWPFPAAGLRAGSRDQSEVESRPDVLVYTSDPLPRDLVVVGDCSVELWAATSANDTDFTAKLVDVRPSGEAMIVQDALLRGRFRDSLERAELLEPHRPYRFTVALGPIAYRFRRNHRLRLEVSSSNFPKFDRNLNTGGPLFAASQGLVAQQTVFHGPAFPSRLRLPVADPRRLRELAGGGPSAVLGAAPPAAGPEPGR